VVVVRGVGGGEGKDKKMEGRRGRRRRVFLVLKIYYLI
jgi:hypothetical protein